MYSLWNSISMKVWTVISAHGVIFQSSLIAMGCEGSIYVWGSECLMMNRTSTDYDDTISLTNMSAAKQGFLYKYAKDRQSFLDYEPWHPWHFVETYSSCQCQILEKKCRDIYSHHVVYFVPAKTIILLIETHRYITSCGWHNVIFIF